MSRFLISLSEEEARYQPNAAEVEGKDGNLYIESSNFLTNTCPRHEKVHCMSYIQFAQRYKVTRSAKKDIDEIDWKNEFYGYLSSELLNADEDHQQNEDIDDHAPKRVVRFHKFSQNKSQHEFYFSEL